MLMRKVEHIERQIDELSHEEFAKLRGGVFERDCASAGRGTYSATPQGSTGRAGT